MKAVSRHRTREDCTEADLRNDAHQEDTADIQRFLPFWPVEWVMRVEVVVPFDEELFLYVIRIKGHVIKVCMIDGQIECRRLADAR